MKFEQEIKDGTNKLRLDLLSPKELKKTYYQSLSLRQLAILMLLMPALGILGILFALSRLMAENSELTFSDIVVPLISVVILCIYGLINVYIYYSFRSNLAKLYMRCSAILGIISSLALGSFSIVGVILCVAVLIYTNNKLLFGSKDMEDDYFSHNQLKMAFKKSKSGQSFTDEELVAKTEPSPYSKPILITAFVFLVLSIITWFL